MIIFFNPIIFIIIVLFVILGGAVAILNKLSAIVWVISWLCMIVSGLYLLGSGNEKSILGKIARILQAGLYITSAYYILVLMEVGKGTERLVNAKLPLLDLLHIRNWDENFIELLLTLIIIGIVSAFSSLARWMFDNHKMLSAIFYGIAIITIAVFYIGGMKLAIKDSYVNSYNSFDFELEKYEVLQDTNIYIEIDAPILAKSKLFKTGVLKTGSKLYGNEKSTGKDNVVYYQVCDKDHEKIGFVSEQDLRALYEIGYSLAEDSPLYGIRKEYQSAPTNTGEYFTICSTYKTDEIIGNIPAGTIVNKGAIVKDLLTGKKDYYEITLSDGTEGAVFEECIEKIKIPIS